MEARGPGGLDHRQAAVDVGDEAVAAVVDTARAQIADGSLRGFSDKDELLEYLRGTHRRSA